jgi:hypothetical protein
MGVLGTAVAALDAHRGLWEVAEKGLLFLRDLALAPENHVRFYAWYAEFDGAFVLAGRLSLLCENALAGGVDGPAYERDGSAGREWGRGSRCSCRPGLPVVSFRWEYRE